MNTFYSIFLVQLLSCFLHAFSRDFDFFYFVQQWPGAYCDTRKSCCYPSTGKPNADFGIHGLWPNFNDGTYPSNCDSNTPFDQTQIKDLMGAMQAKWPTLACPSNDGITFWTHEWVKHGTCCESNLDQHSYFQSALNLQTRLNLLQALTNAGIKPDGGMYSTSDIKDVISKATGLTPAIECNTDTGRNSQLYQIYFCVDKSGSSLIECPVFPPNNCPSTIEFPSF